MSVDTEKLVEIQPKQVKPKRIAKPKPVPVPEPVPEKKRGKLVKGSQEAKDYMAMLRNKKKNKQSS
jgi:hypothetical protein